MKSFSWKIFLCVAPVLLALWPTVLAVYRYQHGLPGSFKLGVDLVGGTILVYEIDVRKMQERTAGGDVRASDRKADINLLASSLKRRIDPNDLYNIVIRPAGETRVEIVLPTGGAYQTELAEERWKEVLDKVKTVYDLKDLPEIGRGKVRDLIDFIYKKEAEKSWVQKKVPGVGEDKPGLLADKEVWKKMLDALSAVRDNELRLITEGPKQDEEEKEIKNAIKPLYDRPGQIEELISAIKKARPTFSTAVLQGWIKGRAWNALIQRIQAYNQRILWNQMLDDLTTSEVLTPNEIRPVKAGDKEGEKEMRTVVQPLRDMPGDIDGVVRAVKRARPNFSEALLRNWIGNYLEGKYLIADLEKISPDRIDILIGRVALRGDLPAQACLKVLEPLTGEMDLSSAGKGNLFLSPKKVEEFVTAFYGPSRESIEERIKSDFKIDTRLRDLSAEEVQRIKDLVKQVGNLEFRILANSADDKEAIKDAQDYINDKMKNRLTEEYGNRGLPPPVPPEGNTNRPKIYTITLKGGASRVQYAWVELDKEERRQLGLDNESEKTPRGFSSWHFMNENRDKAVQIPLHPNDPSDTKKLLQGALFYRRDCTDTKMPEEQRQAKKYEYFVLSRLPELDDKGDPTPAITGKYLTYARADTQQVTPAVSFAFDSEGARLFGILTGKNVPSERSDQSEEVKRHLAIILDGLVKSAPTINSRITDRGQITGNFTRAEVDNLVNILRSGALPATLNSQPVSENTMGPTLGEDTINRGVWAIFYAFLAVLAFMIVYYRFAGMVASVALLANLILTVGFMVAVSATFTLPGLAGLVLMLALAVDANVLIYERLREERERGASLALAIRNGYDRAWPTIIDTHLSSIFTAVVLYIVGNDQLKGFGVTLTVGLIISLYTSLFMTRVMFDFWLARGWLHKLSMMRLFARPDIDFMRIRYYWFTATIVLTIVGLSVFLIRGNQGLNIDFIGGTAYGGELIKPVNVSELRDIFGQRRQETLLEVVKVTESPTKPKREYQIAYKNDDGTTESRVVTFANDAPGNTPEEREQNVAKRAGELPDWAVEQIFLSSDRDNIPEADREKGRSLHFTVRTAEKEPELVQAIVDRLLREKQGNTRKPLLKKVTLTSIDSEGDLNRPEVKQLVLVFDDYASPSFVKTLFDRELQQQFSNPDEARYELKGEQEKEGRYKQMKIEFAVKLTGDKIAKVKTALQKTQQQFNLRPQPDRLENFDTQLAADTRLRAMYAILASWAAILLYLWFRFGNWTFGLAAVLCLIHDLFFTLGIIAFCHYLHGTWFGELLALEDFKIDLPAVAALLTLVGYSVNDTIVVFDRIREVRGKNPDLTPQMINDSVNQTLSRTLLTSFITWLVVLVLYIWGGPGVHLFAFVMVVGVIVGTYSSIYIASPLLLIFGEGTRSTAVARVRSPRPVPAGAPV
jgi:SecD/SecF fusion protein